MVEETQLEGVRRPCSSEECYIKATRLDIELVQVIRNPEADKTAGNEGLARI